MRPRWTGLDTLFAAAVLALFAWNVSRYWFLGDDAFICFRYARNLVDGHGLVYNPGERVEGYTTFSWVLLMAGAMRLGLAPEVVANAVGVAAGLGVLVLLVAFARRRTDVAPGHPAWTWVAPLALASNRTFTAWSTGGLATQLFALLVTAGLLSVAAGRERADGRRVGLSSALLLAAAQLTRPEGVLFAAVAGWFLLLDVRRGARRAGSVARWALAFAALPAAHLAWRLAYYGHPLPNTFYAKVSGAWLEQSTTYLRLFAADHVLWPWLAALAFLLVRARTRTRSLLGGALLAWLGYLLYVGGDRFEYRFLTPVLPLFYLLAADALREVAARLPAGRAPFAALSAAALVATAALPAFVPFEKQSGINSLENIEAVAEARAEEGRFLRSLVEEGLLPADTRIAVRGAGALPWYSGLPTLDLHGLNDPEIARLPLTERGIVAHEKVATPEILEARRIELCEVRGEIVYDRLPAFLDRPVRQAFFEGGYRCLKARGKYLVFASTLTDAEFRERFGRMEIVR